MKYNFDKVIDRRNTYSFKHGTASRGKAKDILPLLVADMDFQTPACVQEELKKQIDHGVFRYSETDNRYFETLEKRQITTNSVKLFILSNPHNPVGRVWTKEGRTKLGGLCVKHHVLVMSDEIRQDFIYQGSQSIVMGIIACRTAYEKGEAWLRELNAYLSKNIMFLNMYIRERILHIKLVKPEGIYLAWLDASGLEFAPEALNDFILNEAKLWLDDGPMFGQGGKGFQQIKIACPRSTLEKALNRLENAVVNRSKAHE